MEERKKEKRWIGIDCGKRIFEVKGIDGADKVTGFNGRTDPTVSDRLIARLRKSDTVGIEAGYPAFVIARQILEQTGCEVVILNPGKLAVIHAVLNKTDKEDSLKLARLVKRFPREELPEVSLPSQEEEHSRTLMSEQGFLKKERTRTCQPPSQHLSAGGIDNSLQERSQGRQVPPEDAGKAGQS